MGALRTMRALPPVAFAIAALYALLLQGLLAGFAPPPLADPAAHGALCRPLAEAAAPAAPEPGQGHAADCCLSACPQVGGFTPPAETDSPPGRAALAAGPASSRPSSSRPAPVAAGFHARGPPAA